MGWFTRKRKHAICPHRWTHVYQQTPESFYNSNDPTPLADEYDECRDCGKRRERSFYPEMVKHGLPR